MQPSLIGKLSKFKKHDDAPPEAKECFLSPSNPDQKDEEEEEKVLVDDVYCRTRIKDIHTPTIKIHVNIPNKGRREIEIDPESTVGDIKQEVYEHEDILPREQKLKLGDTILEDSELIKKYNIQEKTTLDVILQQRKTCFLPDAPITLSDGNIKPIKNLRTGESVLTYNTQKMVLEPKKVTSISVYQSNALSEIYLGSKTIVCTPNHPFWVPNKGWRAVKPLWNSGIERLDIGDKLLDSKLQELEVKGMRTYGLRDMRSVYCLQMEAAHNFFAYGVLAHNMQIFVKLMGGQTFGLNVDLGDSISEIKKELQKQTNIPPQEQHIMIAGKKLDDNRTLSDYNIHKDTTLHLYTSSMINDHLTKNTEAVQLNILFRSATFFLPSLSIVKVKGLRQQIASLVNLPVNEISLFFQGKVILDDEKTLKDYGIVDGSDIILIPASYGGNCLRFMQILEEVIMKDLRYLKSSLNFLDQSELEEFWSEVLPLTSTFVSQYQGSKPEELMAILLWTSNLLYRQVNKALTTNQNLSIWSIYLKYLMTGLKQMHYHKGKVYRGVRGHKDLDLSYYQKGRTITWLTISALSKNKEIAKTFSDEHGAIFEVDVVSTRDISSVSVFGEEEEVILMPYSCLEVMDVVKNPGEPALIKLREIPIPRAPKVLFWVDDNPQNNYEYAKGLEKKGISCVFCTSTQDALNVINNYRWLLYSEKADFRIVTDMVRLEDGVENFTAGIDLLKELFQTYKFTFEVLVFCGNVEKAQENCEAAGLVGPYIISNDEDELLQFINFVVEEKPKKSKINRVLNKIKSLFS